MKNIIIAKFEYDILISLLEELYDSASNEIIPDEILSKINQTRKLFDLELDFYKIRSDKQNPTKKEMVKWLLTKIKNKSVDL